MKQKRKVSKQVTLLLSLAGSLSLVACNGGSNANSTTPAVADNSPLAQFKGSLTYTPSTKYGTNSNALNSTGDTKQQSFVVPDGTTLNLSKVRVTLFGSSDCAYGSESAVITMDGGGAGVIFNSGTYTSSDTSNTALYQRFAATLGNTLQDSLGVRFDYQYNTANGGPGWVSAGCMASGLGNYESTPAPCTAGSACGFKINQVESLPSNYKPYIIMTTNVSNGDLKKYDSSPSATGFTGANAFCMSDPGIPRNGKGSTWVALLQGQSATTQGVTYYNYLGQPVATATGSLLVGFNDVASLTNPISYISAESSITWTGFTPLPYSGAYLGWTVYNNGAKANSCTSWTVDGAGFTLFDYGMAGVAARTLSAESTTSPNDNRYTWNVDSEIDFPGATYSCSNFYHLYCVQQIN